MNFPNYAVLIPAYNAQETIGELIDQLQQIQNKPSSIIVINDGSVDKTSEIIRSKNVMFSDNPKNIGKGGALKKGFEIFSSETRAEYVLCLDADLQHPPKSIQSFLKKVTEEKPLVIIGKREFKIGQMPFLRYLSNTITSFILSKISKQEIKDSQCGFRLISRKVLNRIQMSENGFQFESEFILKCAREKINISFVNIPTIYNNNGSNISHLIDTYKFVRLILKEIYYK